MSVNRGGLLFGLVVMVAVLAGAAFASSSNDSVDARAFIDSGDASDRDPGARDLPADQKEDAGLYLDLTDSVNTLQAALRSQFPGTFGGLWRDPSKQEPTVFISFTEDPGPAFESIRSTFDRPDLLEVVIRPHAERLLEATTELITSEMGYLAEAYGITVVAVGPSLPANKVLIRVKDLTPEMTQTLANRYGAALIDVEPGTSLTALDQ